MMKRGTAVDREINQIYGNDKKMSTKEREVRFSKSLLPKESQKLKAAEYFFSQILWATKQ